MLVPAESPPPVGPFEVFLSYARKDNRPLTAGAAPGWIEALRDGILARHRALSTTPLRIFYDKDDIRGMDDWRHRILRGVQQSKILLVCLSPDYFSSDNCLWEWEEFHRHKASRLVGHESVAPVYFVEAPGSDELAASAFEAFVRRGHYRVGELDKFVPRWREWHAAIRRFNHCDLRPWFPAGPAALAGSDAARRLDTFAGQLTDRIARTRRAAGVPGNLRGHNPHFVGRDRQLVQLHESLLRDGAVGVVTAVNGLGGQGKTEFAVSYAHAHADSYPGGIWVLEAEGRAELLPLLGELANDARLGIPRLDHPDETAAQRGVRVLMRLKEQARAAALRDPDGGAACLLILDNVSAPALLAKGQRAALADETWLRVVATTRLGPADFGPATGGIAFHEMGSLGEDEALDLIRNHQPPRDADGLRPDFAAPAEDEPAARAIVRELGGFTLEVERVAVHLGLHPALRPAAYLEHLRGQGLVSVDALALGATGEESMHHREKRLAVVLEQTLATLGVVERAALDAAALLPPDSVPWPWLRSLVGRGRAAALAPRAGEEDPWARVRRRLEGVRLLTPGDHPEIARMHRMVHAHLRLRLDTHAPELRRRLRDTVEDFALELVQNSRHDRAALWELAPLRETARELQSGQSDVAAANIAAVAGLLELMEGRPEGIEGLLRFSHEIAGQRYAADRADVRNLICLLVATATLAGYLVDRGQAGDIQEAARLKERELMLAEEFCAAELRSDESKHIVMMTMLGMAILLSRRSERGDRDRALDFGERASVLGDELLASAEATAVCRREVGVVLAELAGLLLRRGQAVDADRAISCHERAMEIREELLAQNPGSPEAKQDLTLTLVELAECLERRALPGDGGKAQAHLERSWALSEEILSASHAGFSARNVVARVARGVGDFFERRSRGGDREKALIYFERCRALMDELLAANEVNSEVKREATLALERLGDCLLSRGQAGDAVKAIGHFERSRAIREKLLAENPLSARNMRDVALSCERMGRGLLGRGESGDVEEALGHFERSLVLHEQLLQDSPALAQAKRDLALVLGKRGDCLVRRGHAEDLDQAVEDFERGLRLCDGLLAENPSSTQAASDAIWLLHSLGDNLVRRGLAGDAEKARGCFERSLGLGEELRRLHPDRAASAHDVICARERLANWFQRAGQPAAARVHFAECHRVFQAMEAAGGSLDARMRRFYEGLQLHFGKPASPPPKALNPAELRAAAASSHARGHWDAAATMFERLLALGAPIADVGPSLIDSLLAQASPPGPAALERVEALLNQLAAAGEHERVAAFRRRIAELTARPPSLGRPWWRFW